MGSMKVISWVSADTNGYEKELLIDKGINILRPRKNGDYFTDNVFNCMLWNENCCILIKKIIGVCSYLQQQSSTGGSVILC